MTAAYPTVCPDCSNPITRARSAATGRVLLLERATSRTPWNLDQAGYAYPSSNGQYATHTCATTTRGGAA